MGKRLANNGRKKGKGEKKMGELKFYFKIFVAVVATSIIVTLLVSQARVYTPENVRMMNKIERHETVAQSR